MSHQIAFRAVARNEFAEAAAWYEAQRVGLGSEFTDEIVRCVAAASQQPDLYGAVRGDIRRLPFPAGGFGCVIAAYGILQSLLSERDLIATLSSAYRVLKPKGVILSGGPGSVPESTSPRAPQEIF